MYGGYTASLSCSNEGDLVGLIITVEGAHEGSDSDQLGIRTCTNLSFLQTQEWKENIKHSKTILYSRFQRDKKKSSSHSSDAAGVSHLPEEQSAECGL